MSIHYSHRLLRYIRALWMCGVSCDPSPIFLLNFTVVSGEYCSLRAQHELICM